MLSKKSNGNKHMANKLMVNELDPYIIPSLWITKPANYEESILAMSTKLHIAIHRDNL